MPRCLHRHRGSIQLCSGAFAGIAIAGPAALLREPAPAVRPSAPAM